MGGKGSKALTFGSFKVPAAELYKEGVLLQEPGQLQLARCGAHGRKERGETREGHCTHTSFPL